MKAWQLPSRSLSFEHSLVMGLLNLTPDSFSDGGKFVSSESALLHAAQLIEEGADILDLGAESTRPGAQPVSANLQIERLLPVLKKLKSYSVPISIDTTNSEVAEVCLKEGADIINDVSGLRDSAGQVASVAARFKAGIILMHRRGNAETMQKLAIYEDLITEIFDELEQSVQRAIACGVSRDSLVIDPGFGFSKTAEQSLFLIKEIKKFEKLQLPILLGVSRKSFIGKVTGRDVEAREFGTAACVAYAWSQGVRFFRVHDVRATRDVLKVMQAIDTAKFIPNARLGCL